VAHVWVAHVRRQIDAVYVNRLPLAGAPTRFQRVLLARALGRTMAHEIGHYLLGPRHAPYGLMRPQFTPRELIEALGQYDLDAANRRRLTARWRELAVPHCVPAGSALSVSEP
jgi:hypothetical protein